jgi:hypothetical protein
VVFALVLCVTVSVCFEKIQNKLTNSSFAKEEKALSRRFRVAAKLEPTA